MSDAGSEVAAPIGAPVSGPVTRATLGINSGLLVFFLWFYGGDLFDAVRLRSAEVSGLTRAPNLVVASAALLLALAAGGATLLGVLQKRDRHWRGYRLMPIVAVVVLFVDVLVLSTGQVPLSAYERAALALQVFETQANELSTEHQVPASAESLQRIVDELGVVPYRLKGEAMTTGWNLQVRQECSGPVTSVEQRPVGTLIYCVKADQTEAWVTAVGLPREERFGVPAMVSAAGEPLVGKVHLKSPEPTDSAAVPDGNEGIPEMLAAPPADEAAP